MIRLQQGSNQIYMTLDESNYGSSYSVLRTVDNMSGDESLCILGNDISPNPSRYNEFSLTVATSSVNNTTLVLNNEGQYNYEIWGMTGSSPVGTASILYNGTLLEKGRIVLQ